MRQLPLISGPLNYDASPATPFAPPSRPSRLLRTFVVVWVLAGLVFMAIKLMPSNRGPADIAARSSEPAVTAISTEDLVHHVDLVTGKLTEAAANIRRAQDQVARTLPSLDRNYMLVEKRRMESAAAIIEAVHRDLEQSRQEADLISNSLKKEHELK
jgi:hypothetical protein